MASIKTPYPNEMLTRDQVAMALTTAGYATLSPMLTLLASRGEGPPYAVRPGLHLGTRRKMYTWNEAIAWAKSSSRDAKKNC